MYKNCAILGHPVHRCYILTVTAYKLPLPVLRLKLLFPQAFCEVQIAPKTTAAGALPRTPLGELTALPRMAQIP